MSRTDVHHFYPDIYTEALDQASGDPSGWTIPPWTLEVDQQLGQETGIHTRILSIAAPGVCIEPDPVKTAKLARELNEANTSILHPTAFSPPFLISSTKSIALSGSPTHSIARKADGVILFTRHGGDNHYLGHLDFRHIWTELNARQAVVFIHPTHAVNATLIDSHLPQPILNYPYEIVRTAVDMVLSDLMPHVKDCKIILSHACRTLQYLISRVAGMIPYTGFSVNKITQDIREEAREFYFDTALSRGDLVADFLLGFAKEEHIPFGSDFSNVPKKGICYYTERLNEHVIVERIGTIEIDNATQLFHRLRK